MPARRNGQGKYMTSLVMLNFVIIYSFNVLSQSTFCLDKLFGTEFRYRIMFQ